MKKKVRGLEDELKKSQEVGNKHFNILTDFYSKVKPIVAPPEKTEDKGTETVALVSEILWVQHSWVLQSPYTYVTSYLTTTAIFRLMESKRSR